MKYKFRKTLDALSLMLLWVIVSVFGWSAVFNTLTDTSAEKKLVVYADLPDVASTELAVALEEADLPGIRMVRAYPFTYAMMDSSGLERADLYIVSESEAEKYVSWFCPLPEEIVRSAEPSELLTLDGAAMGLRIRKDGCPGAADSFLRYDQTGAVPGDYYLFFGKNSLHVSTNGGAADDLALTCAWRLTQLP